MNLLVEIFKTFVEINLFVLNLVQAQSLCKPGRIECFRGGKAMDRARENLTLNPLVEVHITVRSKHSCSSRSSESQPSLSRGQTLYCLG